MLPRHQGGRGLVAIGKQLDQQIINLRSYFHRLADSSTLHPAIGVKKLFNLPLVGFIFIFDVSCCFCFLYIFVPFFPATLSSFSFCFFSASNTSYLCDEALEIMALLRLVEIEGGSMVGTGFTSNGTLKSVEKFPVCDNGRDVIGSALVKFEEDETSFIKNVVFIASNEKGTCDESMTMFPLSENIPFL